jgi:hypothetical protein
MALVIRGDLATMARLCRRACKGTVVIYGKFLALGLMAAVLVGCVGSPIQRKDGVQTQRTFTLEALAKSDVDQVSETAQREALRHLRVLTEKLYRRNPAEFRKAGHASVEAATESLFAHLAVWTESPLKGSDWERDFRAAFREDFIGDRVHAYMSAMLAMVMTAYEHKQQFFITDKLDAQKLYNSARNIEIAVWKLSNARLIDAPTTILLTNSMDTEGQNLSYEREFGKLIAVQDVLALVIEDSNNRMITRVVQNAASFVFLPL